jgi:hypothetical protein
VTKRNSDDRPYKLIVSDLNNPDLPAISTNVRPLGDNSFKIREHLWYNLQVKRDSPESMLKEIYFEYNIPVHDKQDDKYSMGSLSARSNRSNRSFAADLPKFESIISTKSFTLHCSLKLHDESIKLTLKNTTSFKILCEDLELDNAELNVFSEELTDKQFGSLLLQAITRVIERKHKQFKDGMPDDFNELLFERLQRITRRYEPDLEEVPNTFQEEQSRSRIVDLQQEGFRIQGKTTDH